MFETLREIELEYKLRKAEDKVRRLESILGEVPGEDFVPVPYPPPRTLSLAAEVVVEKGQWDNRALAIRAEARGGAFDIAHAVYVDQTAALTCRDTVYFVSDIYRRAMLDFAEKIREMDEKGAR